MDDSHASAAAESFSVSGPEDAVALPVAAEAVTRPWLVAVNGPDEALHAEIAEVFEDATLHIQMVIQPGDEKLFDSRDITSALKRFLRKGLLEIVISGELPDAFMDALLTRPENVEMMRPRSIGSGSTYIVTDRGLHSLDLGSPTKSRDKVGRNSIEDNCMLGCILSANFEDTISRASPIALPHKPKLSKKAAFGADPAP